MSKYVLLVLINLPLLIVGVVSALTHYNTKRISRRRMIVEVAFWASIGIALVFAEPLYNALIENNLTDSQPMSLFDIALLTIVIFCLLLIKSSNERITQLHKKISRMHENLAISSADEENHKN
jgi:hypothetical protein